MDWWFGPSIFGVIAAGIAVGLLVSFILIRAQKKRRPYSIETKVLTFNSAPVESFKNAADTVNEFPVEHQPDSSAAPSREIETYLSQRKIAPPAPVAEMPGISKSDALLELENNLAIARRPSTSQLVSFQTKIWSTRRSDFNLADSALIGELSEAYVDMLLANNIVWLVMELGRDSQDLTSSYNKLSFKIAERLQRIMPAARESL
jgi:hypothetical protein